MPPPVELAHDLEVLERKWRKLTRIPEPPRTTMNVIEYSLGQHRKAEEYVNRFLGYVLDPTEPHGMDADFLRAFLEGLPAACSFDEDTYDLSDVQVTDQVRVEGGETSGRDAETESTGIVDLVIEVPQEWVLLIELKFRAGENNLRGDGPSQTECYYQADQVGGEQTTAYESGQYYLYVHHHEEPSAREPAFANWTWKAMTQDVIEPFIASNAPRYPQRTATQLREFVDDLTTIISMSEHQQNDREKLELYLDHYEAIKDVSDTFDAQWEAFTDEWGRLLGEELERGEVATYTELNEDVIAVELTGEDAPREGWRFRTSSSDWGMLFREGWWRHIDDLTPLDGRPDDRNDVRIGFHHRLGRNRDQAIGENELRVYFRNMGANEQVFIDAFSAEVRNRREELTASLPATAEFTGHKRNMIEATYDIQRTGADDFFDAYISALATAFRELVVENPEVVGHLTEAYDSALEMYR